MTSPVRYPNFDDSAICRQTDPELFMVETGEWEKARIAKALCRHCPFQQPCMEWAIANAEYGVWGGTSERQRERIRQARARQVRRAVSA